MRNLNQYYEEYNRLPFEKIQVEYRRKMLISFLKKYEPASILEIGCGLEPLFLHWKNFTKLTIVEPTEMFYKNAKDKSDSYKGIDVKKGTLHDLKKEIKKETFDFIVLGCLLHEIEDPKQMLIDVFEICQENTILHINVPNAFSFHRLLAMEMGLIEDVHDISETQKIMQQKGTFDLNKLVTFVQEQGFQIIEKGSYFIKPFTHSQMQKCMDNDIIDENILNGLFNMVKYLPEMGSEIYVNVQKKDWEK